MTFANFEVMERFTGEKIISKNFVTLALRMVTITFLVLAISGMVMWYEGHSSEADFVLAIDSSGSMLAADYEPSRLSAAKNAATLFIDSLPENSEVGIISFAGISFIKSPMTDDSDATKKSIEGIDVENIGGTAIGDAIVSSSNLLANSERPKTVVLLTDGQSNVGISIQEAILYAKEAGIIVNTIGIGTEKGGNIQNITFVSKLDANGLEFIANETGGLFFMAKNTSELSGAYASIASSTERLLAFNASSLLLMLSLLFFFVEWFLTNTKYKTLP